MEGTLHVVHVLVEKIENPHIFKKTQCILTKLKKYPKHQTYRHYNIHTIFTTFGLKELETACTEIFCLYFS